MRNLFDLKLHLPLLSTQRVRRAIQLGVAAFMLYIGAAYTTAVTDGAKVSIDALNPLDRLGTVWRWLVIGGQSVSKTQLSNLVLGLGLFIAILYGGTAFCGSLNSFNPIQDAVYSFRS